MEPLVFIIRGRRFAPSSLRRTPWGSRGERRRAAGNDPVDRFQARTGARVPQAVRSGRAPRAAEVQILSPRPNRARGSDLEPLVFR